MTLWCVIYISTISPFCTHTYEIRPNKIWNAWASYCLIACCHLFKKKPQAPVNYLPYKLKIRSFHTCEQCKYSCIIAAYIFAASRALPWTFSNRPYSCFILYFFYCWRFYIVIHIFTQNTQIKVNILFCK